jgi:hypothetical protein
VVVVVVTSVKADVVVDVVSAKEAVAYTVSVIKMMV